MYVCFDRFIALSPQFDGEHPYLDVLSEIRLNPQPELYFEIGVRSGRGLEPPDPTRILALAQ